MAADRYALLVLGRPRSTWMSHISSWAMAGTAPIDVHKCLSVGDVRRQIASLKPFSALVVDDGVADVDRDLLATATRGGVATIVITTSTITPWTELGAACTLPPEVTPAQLLQALHAHARPMTNLSPPVGSELEQIPRSGTLITVCGSGGTGATTIAAMLAQSAATSTSSSSTGGSSTEHPETTVLADFTRNAEIGFLHNAPDVARGLEELVDVHRRNIVAEDVVRSHSYAVESRNYRLILGRRTAGSWITMPSSVVNATVGSLLHAFPTTIIDVTADFETEADCGSADIEERNALSLVPISLASAVVAVGLPSLKGIHALGALMNDLVRNGVEHDRIFPVVNRSPRNPIRRAELTAALRRATDRSSLDVTYHGPVFIAEKTRHVECAHHDVTTFHGSLVRPLAGILQAAYQTTTNESPTGAARITPGSLGVASDIDLAG